MATIKSFTDLEQSKKLAEILPIESADMYYSNVCPKGVMYSDSFRAGLSSYEDAVKTNKENIDFYLKDSDYKGVIAWEILPCWSLAALLEQIPYEICDDDGNSAYLQIDKEDDVYQLVYKDPYGNFESIETDRYEHFVNACYEMVLKLKENNLL